MWLLTVFSPTQSARTYKQKGVDLSDGRKEKVAIINGLWEKKHFVASLMHTTVLSVGWYRQRSHWKELAFWINVFQLVHDRKNPFSWASFLYEFLFRSAIKDHMMCCEEMEQNVIIVFKKKHTHMQQVETFIEQRLTAAVLVLLRELVEWWISDMFFICSFLIYWTILEISHFSLVGLPGCSSGFRTGVNILRYQQNVATLFLPAAFASNISQTVRVRCDRICTYAGQSHLISVFFFFKHSLFYVNWRQTDLRQWTLWQLTSTEPD